MEQIRDWKLALNQQKLVKNKLKNNMNKKEFPQFCDPSFRPQDFDVNKCLSDFIEVHRTAQVLSKLLASFWVRLTWMALNLMLPNGLLANCVFIWLLTCIIGFAADCCKILRLQWFKIIFIQSWLISHITKSNCY